MVDSHTRPAVIRQPTAVTGRRSSGLLLLDQLGGLLFRYGQGGLVLLAGAIAAAGAQLGDVLQFAGLGHAALEHFGGAGGGDVGTVAVQVVAGAGGCPVHEIAAGKVLDLADLVGVLLHRGRIEIHAGDAGHQHGDHRDGTHNALLLSAEVLVHEDHDDQGQESQHAHDGAELVLDEELGGIGLRGGVQPVGLLPQPGTQQRQAQIDRDDADEEAHIDRGLQQDEENGVHLQADGHQPGQAREQALLIGPGDVLLAGDEYGFALAGGVRPADAGHFTVISGCGHGLGF